MKTVWVSVMAGILAAGLVMAAEHPGAQKSTQTQQAKITLQTTCPITGNEINKDLYVDHDGKRVYVCCTDCLAVVKKDPETYIKKLEADGITVAKVQTMCPVMGGKINKDLYVDHDGKRVYVCCQACVAAVKKDPEKYIKKMEAEGVALAPVPQEAQPKVDVQGKP